MNLLEIIQIRLYDAGSDRQLEAVIADIRQQTPEVDITLYRDPLVDGDWTFHLRWDSLPGEIGKSRLALLLADFFRSLGLVNHSLLLAVPPAQNELPELRT